MYVFKLLEQAGYEVFAAHDGPTGLHAAEQLRPHLIPLDIRMPHMNGDEVLMKTK